MARNSSIEACGTYAYGECKHHYAQCSPAQFKAGISGFSGQSTYSKRQWVGKFNVKRLL